MTRRSLTRAACYLGLVAIGWGAGTVAARLGSPARAHSCLNGAPGPKAWVLRSPEVTVTGANSAVARQITAEWPDYPSCGCELRARMFIVGCWEQPEDEELDGGPYTVAHCYTYLEPAT